MAGKRSVLALALALVLAACGAPGTHTSSDAAGPPVAGGTGRVIHILEPRSLDPAVLANAWAVDATLGNALYGTLVANKPETGEVQLKMAEDFSSPDGGTTFRLRLRPGLKFSDGSPLDAQAVKVNWDRIRDPAVGASSVDEASIITSTTVVDATTLAIKLGRPDPSFPQVVALSSLNWTASPKILQEGRNAIDANPVGAGPFVLTKWARGNSFEFAKNPGYWDAPKPYLDHLVIRVSADGQQRLNTVTTGAADLEMESSWAPIAKAKSAGLATYTPALSGGDYLSLNTARAPFNDVRARRAVASALDINALNLAAYEGKSPPATTLFDQSSPFYADVPLQKTDKAEAQRLFDELAAEGKPVTFTFKALATSKVKAVAENVQAQLSAFRNVTVKIQSVDAATAIAVRSSRDYDVVVGSAFFGDPEPRLWTAFHAASHGNASGLDDPQLNAALDAGRLGKTTEDRKAAYLTVQQRIADQVPVIFTGRAAVGAIAARNVHGVVQYGMGSVLPEELWIGK